MGRVSSGKALVAQILSLFIYKKGEIKSSFPISGVMERESNEIIYGEHFEKFKAPCAC